MDGSGAGDVILNLTFDSSVASAPAGFTTAIASAVNFFESNFSDPVTVNIAVGYGEVQGQALPSGALGESVAVISSFAYSALKIALAADASSSTDASAVASLPAIDPTGGYYWVTQAEAKALGLQTGGGLDGYVGFQSTPGIFDFDESNGISAGKYDFFSVFVHEVSEVMGRQMLDGQTVAGQPNSYEPLDLFHFSAPGVRIFSGVQTGYFSADNGVTNLDNFNTLSGGDFGDWAASAGRDAFLAFSSSGVVNAVSAADMKVMDVVGWNVVPLPDLIVGIPTVSASAINFVVSNIGQASAAASTAGIYLSADSSITSADILLATYATPALASQATDSEVASIAFPTNLAPGTYYVGVIADQGGQVTEFNENNNVSASVPVILGNNGDNTLTGNSAGNVLVGLAGDDSLNGGAGADTMIGGTGNDSYVVDRSTDVVVENPGEGVDAVFASATYVLPANVENLTLTGTAAINGTGNADANLITGNAANNVLAGLAGADTMDGGGGVDTVSYAASAAGVSVSLTTGSASGGDAEGDVLINIENLTGSAFNDTLEGGSGDNVLSGGAGVDLLTYEHATAGVSVNLALTTAQNTGGAGTDTITLFENLTGTAYGDTLTGNSAGNVLVGLAGDDSLNGGAGADTMIGGTGNDSYVVDRSTDVVVENPGEGVDAVFASATYVLPANVENLTLTRTAAINGTGNADANLITGNAANNVLAGLAGDDTLIGGGGVDSLSGGVGADHFVFADVTASGDTIKDFSHAQGDLIDLSGIDANSSLAGDQAFVFIGTEAFHEIAGELRFAPTAGGIAVTGDTNGDGIADFTLNLSGVSSLVSGDFIL